MIDAPQPLRIAMLGMIPGNGHPYSWSAIINGYDPVVMAQCPYPAIPEYLGNQDLESVRIAGAQVTHLWTDNPDEADHVARAARIPNVVSRAVDVIGDVDAVIISTDDGEDHVRRAAPFIEAGLPVFVDKPLAVSISELRQFVTWKEEGARILSSSGMRYAVELEPLRNKNWEWLTSTTAKTLERYGIHALEPLFVLLGTGFQTVSWAGNDKSCVVTATHRSGALVTITVIPDAATSFGVILGFGASTREQIQIRDTYSAFRGQLVAAVEWFRSGVDPYPFAHTVELMAVLIAARESRANHGRAIEVAAVLEQVNNKI